MSSIVQEVEGESDEIEDFSAEDELREVRAARQAARKKKSGVIVPNKTAKPEKTADKSTAAESQGTESAVVATIEPVDAEENSTTEETVDADDVVIE